MKTSTLLLALLLAAFGINAQTNITDASLTAGGTYTWTKNNVYLVSGLTFLEDGGTLTIEAGTVVQFVSTPSDTSGGNNTSALIIAKGAQIFVEGTAAEPVIFTYEGDDVTNPDDINDPITRGQWGGLIVLGNATIARPGGEDQIEGISAQEPRARYGGTDDMDNSGRIRYLSIRHGGRALSPGNEINGLTLGGVGSGTEIEFVEVFANDDDGIEWFGGTVNVSHAVVSFGKDDSYDYDYGWRGKGQFWFSINSDDISGRAGEHDGAKPDDEAPFSNPTIANATYIGSGVASTPGEDGNDYAIVMRDNAGGKYYNSVFTDFPERFINLEDLPNASGVDSYMRLQAGDINFDGNIVGNFGGDQGDGLDSLVRYYTDGDDPTASTLKQMLSSQNRFVGSDQIVYGIGRDASSALDPRPQANSPALDASELADFNTTGDEFFRDVRYAGAFGPGNSWIDGWTALSHYGITGNLAPANDITITDASLVGGGENYTWTPNNRYVVDGLTFLEGGSTLTIEAGTVVEFIGSPADSSGGNNTSALIITKDAQLFVNGTQNEPVIFTYENDDVTDPNDINDPITRGQWGGLIILGNATIARPGGTDQIEGISAQEPRAQYGGTNDADNSGRINYLSIRHGGRALSPGNEINGLTLGGVGSGTEIDYVEVFANDDDGIEWFGGTVNVSHAAVSFGKDDSYDYDYGWRGNGQYWFSLNSDDISGRAGEHDGAKPDDEAPFSNPTIANATYIGSGVGSTPGEDGNDYAIVMRDNAGGKYFNSIFTDFPENFINLEDLDSGAGVDSYERLVAGDIQFRNNVIFNFGGGSTFADLINLYPTGDDPTGATLLAELSGTNVIADPNIGSISRFSGDNQLDPRIAFGAALGQGDASLTPDNGFFEDVSYIGAFDNETNWMLGWTALDDYGYFGNLVSSIEDNIPASSVQLVPNPASDYAELTFSTTVASDLSIEIISLTGQVISQQRDFVQAGAQRFGLSTSQLIPGMYSVRIVTEAGSIAKQLIVAGK